jgi:glycosyltransferase involved in cell wall biosynthesis
MPLFSIIIPLYNKQKDIAATLKSVFAQAFTDYEIIVINDGSTDRSENEVLKFDDPRLKYQKIENRGVSQARNTGIEMASGKIIAFLDADDHWLPDHLETIYNLHTDFPEAGIIATNYKFIYPDGKVMNTNFSSLGTNFRGLVDNVFRHSLNNRLFWTSCVAVKKEVFEKTGRFDTSITLGAGEDTDMWIRIALNYPAAFTTKVTAHYNLAGSNRISHSQTLTRSFAKFDKFASEEAVDPHLKKYLDLYRADYALKHKMAGDLATASFYENALDPDNLSGKARLLLKLPVPLLRLMLNIKRWLAAKGLFIDIYN